MGGWVCSSGIHGSGGRWAVAHARGAVSGGAAAQPRCGWAVGRARAVRPSTGRSICQFVDQLLLLFFCGGGGGGVLGGGEGLELNFIR